MSTQISLVGQVVSGRGLGTLHVLRHAEALRAIVNEPLYPGTLNVILNKPFRFLDSAGRQFDPHGGRIWPASLRGLEVWLYRWRTCPLHVVEVFSPICLRDRLSLKDGHDVHLHVGDEHSAAIDMVGNLAWAALWMGRRRSFFLRESCHTGTNRTMIWSSKFGALQQPAEIQGARRVSLAVSRKFARETAAVGARVFQKVKTRVLS